MCTILRSKWPLETPIWGGYFRSKKFRRKNCNIFPKIGGEGGGQRPFGTFPKIHRYWYRQASLREYSVKNILFCHLSLPVSSLVQECPSRCGQEMLGPAIGMEKYVREVVNEGGEEEDVVDSDGEVGLANLCIPTMNML